VLSLNPPFLMVDGISVFGDHLDPQQWYYLPLSPRLVTRTENGTEVPAFSLLRFKGGSGESGGFLNFDVDLHVDAALLDEVAGKIRSQQNLHDLPRLAPVPLESGTVKLLVLGDDSTAPATDPAAPRRFVLKSQHNAQPSLYGDNAAAFSVQLDEDGAVLVERSIDGELSPVGVVYSLDYIGLRPAYNVHLSIDWQRVQEHLDTSFAVDALFVSTDITTAVDKLIEDRVIVVEVDTFVLDTAENKGVIAGRDAAVAEVYDMITDAFFTASIDPTKEAPDGWDKATQLFDHFSPAAQAKSLLPHFSYSSNEARRTDKKRLNVNLSERTAVLRSIYPQGHLSGIASSIRDSGLPRSDFVKDVDLDDPWFQRRQVEVISRVDFTTGHVASASVEMRYGGTAKSALFDATSTAPVVLDWSSVVEDGRMVQPVETDVAVNLTQVEDLTRPMRLTYTAPPVETEKFEARTEDLFRLVTIPVLTDGVPWDRWDHVEVGIRYVDEANGIHQESVFDLNQGVPAWNYQIFVVDPAKTDLDYRLTYHAVNGQDAVHDWQTTDEVQVRIRNPFRVRRDVIVSPAVSWAEVDRVLVDLRYADPENEVLQEQSFELTADDAASRTFTVDLRNPELRRVEYRTTLLFKDGHQVVVPDSATEGNRILVSPTMRARQVVSVEVAMAGAPALGIAEAVVALTPGLDGGVPVTSTFTPGSRPVEVGFDFDTDPVYRYQVEFHHTNGRRRAVAAVVSRDPHLLIPVS
jgi:hypothetical protein